MNKRTGANRVLIRLKPQLGKNPVRFIEALAEDMVRRLGRSEPPFQTQAFEYATLAGARVIETDIPKYAGLMSVFNGRIIIEINRNDSAERKNFTVCHEVGHIELRKAANLLRPSRAAKRRGRFIDKERSHEGTTKREERLVEKFAANILMPKDVFRDKAKPMVPGLESAKRLSEMFRTSLGATLRRIAEVRVWPCVIIWGIPERMKAENDRAVRIQEIQTTVAETMYIPKHNYVRWAGEQFWRASQTDSMVKDTIPIHGECWRIEAKREWHYTPTGVPENRVVAMLLPSN